MWSAAIAAECIANQSYIVTHCYSLLIPSPSSKVLSYVPADFTLSTSYIFNHLSSFAKPLPFLPTGLFGGACTVLYVTQVRHVAFGSCADRAAQCLTAGCLQEE
ncbi:hypothetical protein CEP54_015619 [Fusarium duplospermum]|uniref:Uncharacterized protein n=1 Tax=Fusarium duplospermum TaxID=1325734 RepID=A0A428NMU5_9HYPO|nr:hypothetical protein CEP54_015619 [Fusarium duplospermum]